MDERVLVPRDERMVEAMKGDEREDEERRWEEREEVRKRWGISEEVMQRWETWEDDAKDRWSERPQEGITAVRACAWSENENNSAHKTSTSSSEEETVIHKPFNKYEEENE